MIEHPMRIGTKNISPTVSAEKTKNVHANPTNIVVENTTTARNNKNNAEGIIDSNPKM